METTDLITSFFNNEMNPEQERTFLLSVAASDAMRLGLKSHVMIDRILLKQAGEVRVPELMRKSIMARAGVSVAMPADTAPSQSAASPRSGFASRGMRVVSALLLLVCGGTAGYFIHPDTVRLEKAAAILPVRTPSPVPAQVTIPQAGVTEAVTTGKPAQDKTIAAVSTPKQNSTIPSRAVTRFTGRTSSGNGTGDKRPSPLEPSSKGNGALSTTVEKRDTAAPASGTPAAEVSGHIHKSNQTQDSNGGRDPNIR